MKKRNFAVIGLLGAALFAGPAAHAGTHQQLVRCSDTNFEAGFYGTYYGALYHGTTAVCGGDSLVQGSIDRVGDYLHLSLKEAGPDPYILYEVYWVPIGGDPVADRVLLGDVITDCNRNVNALVKSLATPADLSNPPTNVHSLIASPNAGFFMVYSRGTQSGAVTGSSTCNPATLDPGYTFTPVLWGGAGGMFDGVQFLSGMR